MTGPVDLDAFLEHFGVKGMKWGVHKKERTAASTETKAQRKEAKVAFRNFSNEAFDRKYGKNMFDTSISEAQYKKLSNKADVINKGHTLYRVSQRKGEKFDGITYVSTNQHDRGTYRAIMPVVSTPLRGSGRKQYKASYESTFKALETLKSPSEKERVDAFSELFDSPSIVRRGKTITGREYIKNLYPKEAKQLTAHQLGLKLYKDFAAGQYAKNPINDAYFDSLRKKGYNALVDDNDRHAISKQPLILLNPDGSLKRMSVKPLTADEINKAQRELSHDW